MANDPRIFISFSTTDELVADFVRLLLISLKNQDLSPWIYESSQGKIKSGENIIDACKDEIDQCDLFIPIVSDSTFSSHYTKLEVEYFFQNQKGKILIPIIFTDIKEWVAPYNKLQGIKGYKKSRDELKTLDLKRYIEDITNDICTLFNINYTYKSSFNNRLPLTKNIINELKGKCDFQIEYKTDEIRHLLKISNKLESFYNDCNFDQSLKYLGFINDSISDDFRIDKELYYTQIVKGILETEESLKNNSDLDLLKNPFKKLIDESHPNLDANAYAGLASIELLCNRPKEALFHYKIAKQYDNDNDLALLHNILLSQILSGEKIEDSELLQLKQYLDKGKSSQEVGSLDRIFFLYLLSLSYNENINEAIIFSKNSNYDMNSNFDLIERMIETILDIAERNHNLEYLNEALELIDYILLFEDNLSEEFTFYLSLKKIWILYDKGISFLDKS